MRQLRSKTTRLLTATALGATLALPGAAVAMPAPGPPAHQTSQRAGEPPADVQRIVQTDFGGRTLALALSGTALLIAAGGTAHSLTLRRRFQRPG
jgi:hypothetical protein